MKWLRNLLGVRPRIIRMVRSFMKAGETSRLNADWMPATLTGDAAVLNKIVKVRDRMRQQEYDNDYARSFYNAVENNVLGCEGLCLTVKARMPRGKLDKEANDAVWAEWMKWGKLGNCDVTGELSWIDLQKLALRTATRDGGVLIRKRVGRQYGPHGFQLQLYEIDQLDSNYTGQADNGNSVFHGIEKDDMGRTVAYYILDRHPGDIIGLRTGYRQRRRVPSEEIIHYYVKERITGSIGVPRLISAADGLHHLNEYESAELMQSRAAAQKGGWFESETGASFPGEEQVDEEGNKSTLNDFEPFSFDELPKGTKFIPYDPKHPTDAFSDFVRAKLIGAASGACISYSTLTGDLSQANYSSMRSGKLEEQETWKKWQKHFIEHFAEPIFSAWLEIRLLQKIGRYSVADFDRLNAPMFRGRRWPWVDPAKDVRATVEAIEAGLTSRTKVIEEQGGDIEQVFEELSAENELAESAEISISTAEKEPAEEADPDEMDSEEEDDSEDSRGINGHNGRVLH